MHRLYREPVAGRITVLALMNSARSRHRRFVVYQTKLRAAPDDSLPIATIPLRATGFIIKRYAVPRMVLRSHRSHIEQRHDAHR